MKSKKRYTKNDRVLVKSFAGPRICVILKRRYLVSKSEHKLGVDGWEAQITNQQEVDKLRKKGVPYKKGEKPTLNIIPGTEKTWPCELALLALGFTGPGTSIVDQLGLETDFRTNIKASTSDYKTNIPGVFAAGDIRRGQSLIVWAISEGRQAAYHIDKHLMGDSNLPLKDDNDLPRL